MAAREVVVKVTGSTRDLEAALERAGLVADVQGKRIGESFSAGASKAGGALSKLANLGASFGLPFMGHLDTIGKKLDEASTKTARFSTALAEAGKVTLIAGTAGFAGAAAEATKLGVSFQTATASIAANAGITQGAANAIGRAFLDAAGKTIFSGQEMASAFATVAGQLKLTEGHALSSAEALKVMTAAGDLAEASHETLANSTSALASVMQAYRLSVDQAASAGDTLFNVSKSINVPVDGVATALERLHGRLGELAPSLKDVAGLLVDLAGHGITGQRGVQVVNTALQTLVGNSKNTKTVLHDLGVSVFDSAGHFVGLQSVIQQLQPKLASLTQQQQIFVAQTLFGKSAAQVMQQVIQDGVGKFNAATDAATKMGTAHQAATLQSKTLHNQLETLKSTVEDLGTKFGLFLIPKLEAVGSAISKVIQWFEKHKTAATALAAVITGVLGAAIGAFVGQRVAAFIGGIQAMAGGMAKLASGVATAAVSIATKLGIIGPAATTAEAEVATADAGIVASADATATGVDAALGATGVGAVLVGVGLAATTLASNWSTIWSGIQSVTDTIANAIIGILNSLIDAMNSAINAWNSVAGSIPLLGSSLTIGTIGHIGTISMGGGGSSALPTGPGGISATALLNPGTLSGGGGGSAAGVSSGLPVSYGGGASNPGIAGLMNGSGSGKGHKSKGVSGNIPGLSAAQNAVARQLFGYFTSQGLSPAGAAAIIGNWVQESSLNPAEPGGYLAQWGGSRFAAEGAYAASHGLAATSVAAEAGFAMSELQGGYPSLLAMLRTTTDPRAAALAVSNQYERPAAWAANNANRMNQAALAFGALSGTGYSSSSGGPSAIATSIANSVAKMMQALATQAANILKSLGDAIQNGTLKTLENLLGFSTGGSIQTGTHFTGRGRHRRGHPIMQTVASLLTGEIGHLGANASIGQIDAALGGTIGKASAGSPQEKSFNALVAALNASGQKSLAQQLVAAHKAAMATLAQEVYAEQVTKDGELLNLQATALKDQTQAAQNAANAQIDAAKAVHQQTVDALDAQVTAIKDMTQIMQDQGAAMVQSIQDASQAMTDQLDAVATGINDQTQVKVDVLGERGLFGLNLIAQELRVSADQVKAYWDQQIATAKANLDAVTASGHASEQMAQIGLDQVQYMEDAKVSAAQQASDLMAIKMTALIAQYQAHADAVLLHEDTSVVGPAQIAVDLGATLPKSVQDVLNSQLKKAQGRAAAAEGQAAQQLQGVTALANALMNNAQNAVAVAQANANQAIGNANQALVAATTAANTAIANANTALAVAQGQAGIAEASATGAAAIAGATASTQFAGSGLVVNIYGIPESNATAMAGAFDWVARNNLGLVG